ncbi:MAG: RNA methyltransferase [Muribaculaceae bacterium]|nr:RNA methyltransferase [Muribaculaceae bacterium]
MADLGRATIEEFHAQRKFPIAVVLDNIRSLNNIGSIFRSADAFAADRVVLCGITATPPSVEIHKTALGAENSMDWTYYPSTAEALDALRAEGWLIAAIEQAADSVSLEDFRPDPDRKIAIVLGHEVYGVDQSVVDAADLTLEIPQFGTKHSLNVAVTAGILLWHLTANRLNQN